MNKTGYTLFLAAIFCCTLHAQNTEKVKGNKNVTIQETLINPFRTIDLDEDFEIEIVYGKIPSVEIEADENLHEVIDFEVRDSVLSFNKTKRITSKKRLKIKVKYDDNLTTIITSDDAEIESLASMELHHATLKTSGSSAVNLTIKTDFFSFEGKDRSKVKLDLMSDNSKITLNDTSKLDGLVNSPELSLNLYQRADAAIAGNGENLVLRTTDNSKFEGKDYIVKVCDLACEISSDATINPTESIVIDASGGSSIYLYNTPKITINKLTDTAKLQKKAK